MCWNNFSVSLEQCAVTFRFELTLSFPRSYINRVWRWRRNERFRNSPVRSRYSASCH
jgi:hypothetical protein